MMTAKPKENQMDTRNAQVANLLLAAMPTHKWYLAKFSNYPKHRKALIPFVY